MECVLLLFFVFLRLRPVRLDYSTLCGAWQDMTGEFLKFIYRRNKTPKKNKTPANRSLQKTDLFVGDDVEDLGAFRFALEHEDQTDLVDDALDDAPERGFGNGEHGGIDAVNDFFHNVCFFLLKKSTRGQSGFPIAGIIIARRSPFFNIFKKSFTIIAYGQHKTPGRAGGLCQ